MSDGQVSLCDIKSSAPACESFESIGTLNDLRFSASDRQLAIADKNIRLIPVPGGPGKPLAVRDDQENYGSVRFSSDGRFILTINGKGAIMIVDLKTGQAKPGHCCTSIWGDIEFGADETQVIWAGHWPGAWDLRSGGLAGRFTDTREFMAFGPIATDRVRGLVYMGSQDGRVYQWSLSTRKLLRKSPPLSGYVRTISVLGRSGWIAYAAEGGSVHLWYPETAVSRVIKAARTTGNLVFDESLERTALGTVSGNVEFWDLIQARLVSTIPAPK